MSKLGALVYFHPRRKEILDMFYSFSMIKVSKENLATNFFLVINHKHDLTNRLNLTTTVILIIVV